MCSEIIGVLVNGHYPVDPCLLPSCHEKTRQKEKWIRSDKWILLPLISQIGGKTKWICAGIYLRCCDWTESAVIL